MEILNIFFLFVLYVKLAITNNFKQIAAFKNKIVCIEGSKRVILRNVYLELPKLNKII